MAFADPQSVTINSVAISLPRTSFGANSGEFTSNDTTLKESIASSYGAKRTRRTLRLDFNKIAPDPLVDSNNILYSMSTYIVVDVPITGFTVAEQKQVVDGLIAYLSASSGSKITQLLGGEV